MAAVGERVGDTVVIRNSSLITAESVVVADQPGNGERPIASRSIQRRCSTRGASRKPVYLCAVGNLGPGEVRRYKFELLVTARSGSRVDNIAAVISASADRIRRNNFAVSRVRVRNLVCAPGIGLRPRRDAFASC